MRKKFARYLSAFLQVGLFVLTPVSLAIILPMFGIKAGVNISVDYVITLIVFGFALQLCRIVSGNIWMNIGFHMAFLMNSRFLISDKTNSFIQVELIHEMEGMILIFLGPCLFTLIISPFLNRLIKEFRNNQDKS